MRSGPADSREGGTPEPWPEAKPLSEQTPSADLVDDVDAGQRRERGGVWEASARWFRRLRRAASRTPAIPDDLWCDSIRPFSFLVQLPTHDRERLKLLAREFLAQKEFHGAGGLKITDQMAIAIAAQACLPVLHLPPLSARRVLSTASSLDWYGDFVGIVVHPAEVVARRARVDDAGVVHHYDEVLSGEAMELGPIMLSWADVAQSGETAERGYNVVIHEFAHKIDMADGVADGCPRLWPGFMGHRSEAEARRAWLAIWQASYDSFCEFVQVAERFGGAEPWLDRYGAQSLDEFFAVASEAYFVNRQKFGHECAILLPWMDAFYRSETPLRAERLNDSIPPGRHGPET